MVHTHNAIVCSPKERNHDIYRKMDVTGNPMFNKISETQKDKHCIFSYMHNLNLKSHLCVCTDIFIGLTTGNGVERGQKEILREVGNTTGKNYTRRQRWGNLGKKQLVEGEAC